MYRSNILETAYFLRYLHPKRHRQLRINSYILGITSLATANAIMKRAMSCMHAGPEAGGRDVHQREGHLAGGGIRELQEAHGRMCGANVGCRFYNKSPTWIWRGVCAAGSVTGVQRFLDMPLRIVSSYAGKLFRGEGG